MDIGFYVNVTLALPIIILILIVVIKTIVKREIREHRYTPFDYIMGQTPIEYYEEKNEKEEESEQGDDKDKPSSNSAIAAGEQPFTCFFVGLEPQKITNKTQLHSLFRLIVSLYNVFAGTEKEGYECSRHGSG
ncbi:hypothetical protein [Marinicrinis lubricantis]|uniref:Uncharacterized protein n=1 Tax=Marinicrinis lubricantis TaxID=2086470 RepID=A0ABW1IRK6_9BACL